MNRNTNHSRFVAISATFVFAAVTSAPVNAQLAPPKGQSYGGSVPGSEEVVSGIAWYGVLQDGLDEAKRSGRPILFVTAAPLLTRSSTQ